MRFRSEFYTLRREGHNLFITGSQMRCKMKSHLEAYALWFGVLRGKLKYKIAL